MTGARARTSRPAALFILAGACGAAWLSGFIWFVHDSLRPAPLPAHADGIVALTGGADRIATALQLLQQNRGRLLLISGVGPTTEFTALFRGTGIAPAALEGRITIGRSAIDTLGNADEAADWARSHDLHSLIVVTATYHMKRALTEIGRTLPDVTLYPAPVVPPALRGSAGVATIRLLADEYTKFLAAQLGLSRLQRVREAVQLPPPQLRSLPVSQPSPGQPSPGQPSLGQPSLGQPSPGQPSLAQPSPGQPPLIQPSVVQPSGAHPPAAGNRRAEQPHDAG